MEKEILKMLQVEADTHKKVKRNAVLKNMSIRDYVRYLVEMDEKKGDK